MIIDIQSRHFKLTAALRAHVESKLRLNLGRYDTNISRVEVSLFDVNGPKGGEDMCCKTVIRLKGMPTVVVEYTTIDMYDAVNKCLHKAKRTVKRSVRLSSWKTGPNLALAAQ